MWMRCNPMAQRVLFVAWSGIFLPRKLPLKQQAGGVFELTGWAGRPHTNERRDWHLILYSRHFHHWVCLLESHSSWPQKKGKNTLVTMTFLLFCVQCVKHLPLPQDTLRPLILLCFHCFSPFLLQILIQSVWWNQTRSPYFAVSLSCCHAMLAKLKPCFWQLFFSWLNKICAAHTPSYNSCNHSTLTWRCVFGGGVWMEPPAWGTCWVHSLSVFGPLRHIPPEPWLTDQNIPLTANDAHAAAANT